jgi:hypothetical protein
VLHTTARKSRCVCANDAPWAQHNHPACRPDRYVLDRYAFEAEAKTWLQSLADPPPSSSSPSFVVHGVEVVTQLWDEALKFTQDGTLDVVEARDLWAMASPDEDTCEPMVSATLRLVLAQMHSSPNAYKFLVGKLGGEVRVPCRYAATRTPWCPYQPPPPKYNQHPTVKRGPPWAGGLRTPLRVGDMLLHIHVARLRV